MKKKSTPSSHYSIFKTLSLHFCFNKFCYNAKNVRLWLICCRTCTTVFQSWGVNFFLQSGHWVYTSTNYTTYDCYTFSLSLTSRWSSIFILNLLECGYVHTNLALLKVTLLRPLTFLRSSWSIYWLYLSQLIQGGL